MVFYTSGYLHSNTFKPEKRLSHFIRQNAIKNFSINAISPLLLAKSIEKFIKPNLPFHFACLSARVGSITDNRSGGWYSYRTSKAAQNQILKTLSIEWKRKFPMTTVSILHPGTCDNKLSQPFQSSVPEGQLFSPDKSSQYLLNVLSNQKTEDTGNFLAWDGSVFPW